MVDEKVRLIMGSLLHDTGKVIYRQGDDRRNHSISGYDYLKEETNLTDSEILDCVRYHHASLLKRAVGLKENSLAYIVYLADNIAAFSDLGWIIDIIMIAVGSFRDKAGMPLQ